jgi:hypothetical protein
MKNSLLESRSTVKKLILSALFVFPVISHAAFFELPTEWDLGSPSLITNHTDGNNSFIDEWSFTVNDPNSFTASAGFLMDGLYVDGIENFSGYLIGDNFDRLDFKADKSDLSNTYLTLAALLQTAPLTAGNYSLVFEGSTIAATGGYYGANPVSAAVPEPEAMVLMGIGLGLVSLMKRKKAL